LTFAALTFADLTVAALTVAVFVVDVDDDDVDDTVDDNDDVKNGINAVVDTLDFLAFFLGGFVTVVIVFIVTFEDLTIACDVVVEDAVVVNAVVGVGVAVGGGGGGVLTCTPRITTASVTGKTLLMAQFNALVFLLLFDCC